MNRPKFAVGERVDYVGPSNPVAGVEIINKTFLNVDTRARCREQGGEICFYDGKYGPTFAYEFSDKPGFVVEHFVRKRPDKGEPFSIEALKTKYSGVEA